MIPGLSKLKVKNFIAPPELIKKIKRSLERVTDLSPSDSFVNAVLEQNSGGYSCEISVNSSQNRWSVLRAANFPADAVMAAVGSVLNDLTSWKKDRFK